MVKWTLRVRPKVSSYATLHKINPNHLGLEQEMEKAAEKKSGHL
jgi:hypothetical protein